MGGRAWVAAVAILAGCTGGGSGVHEEAEVDGGFYADAVAPTRAQSAELSGLGQVDEAAFRPHTHELAFLRGPALAQASGDPGGAAVAFADAHPALFLGARLRVDSVRDAPDGTVVHTSELAGNRRVLEGAVTFAFDRQGALVQVAGRTYPGLDAPDPVLGYPEAEAAARAYLSTQLAGAASEVVSDEAVLLGGRGGYRVELEAEGPAGPTRREIVVDDQTGAVRSDLEALRFARAEGRGVFGEARTFEAGDLGDGTWALVDATRGEGLATYAWTGGALPGALVQSPERDQWDASGAAAGAAVDAHANAELVYDFFRELGRDGLDGRAAPILTTVHYGYAYPRAFWDGAQAVFGDGDGVHTAPLSGGLDVVAHELTHGVTQFACKLDGAGQPGALDEALADAFASLVQLRAGHPEQAWRFGADVARPGQPEAMRDLADPARLGQPDHMSQYRAAPLDARHDDGAVHWNATIPGHALYLMAMGGLDQTSGLGTPGIGPEHAERVLYHALTHGLSRTADFAQCARATVASARRLYGEGDARAVQAAWEAVGVLVPVAPGPRLERPEQEPNDALRSAQPLGPEAAVDGALDSELDVDSFRFEVERPTDVDLVLSELTADLDLRLYDAGGRLLARSERPGSAGERITGRVARGAYYLRVFAGPGVQARGATYRLALSEVRR